MSGRGAPALLPARSLRAHSMLRAPSLRAPSLRVPALLVLSLLAAPVLPSAAFADAPLFIVEPSQMPFDLGPGAPANQPSRAGNLPHAPGNSGAAPGNGSGIRANAPDNPANLPGGGRTIWAGDEPVGYYTRNGGTLNLFDRRGHRIAYRPGGGRTKSLFSLQGTWCGTVAETADGIALGLTRDCANALLR